jgi:hypothetical protein
MKNVPAVKSTRGPKCNHCKYYDKGRCRLFLEMKHDKNLKFALARVVRLDENACGSNAVFWNPSPYERDPEFNNLLVSDMTSWMDDD